MRAPRRLETHPRTRIERGNRFTFHHEGRPVEAYTGETVAAALYAAGRPVLSRSMRYHRARGLFCATGTCTHCFLRIDGVPNARACTTVCSPTTWSEGQNAFPNVSHDLLAASDLAFPRYLDAHTSFLRPRFLRPLFTRVIRSMAGFGRVPREPVRQSFQKEQLETEVLVVGSGPAGLAAAEAAASAGRQVTLLEAEDQLGGRLRMLPTPFLGAQESQAPETEGKTYAESAAQTLEELGVRLWRRAQVFGIYGGVWAAATPTKLLEIRAQRVVLAPGSHDAYLPFPGSDRAGVLLSSAALRLLNVHGIAPAEPVVVYGATRAGLLLARDLAECGVEVTGVFDERPDPPVVPALGSELKRLNIPIHAGHRIAFVAGRTRPRALLMETPRGRIRVGCATLVLATGRQALGQLFQQAGAALRFDASTTGFLPRVSSSFETTSPGLYAAGSAAGSRDEWASGQSGRIAGAAAAESLPEGSVADRSRRELAMGVGSA